MRHRLLRLILVPALLVGALGMAGPVAAAESTTEAAPGTLAARVHGLVKIGGSFALEGAMDGGGIRISGFERDCTLRVASWTSKTIHADGTIEFHGVDGRFAIKCRSIVVELRSAEMRWQATGHGRARLDAGRAAYSLNGAAPAAWPVGAVVGF